MDGDWFTHYLDSPEQGLIVIQLFNDIIPRAGATWIVEDGLKHVCKWYVHLHRRVRDFIRFDRSSSFFRLYDRPQGEDGIFLRDTETNVAVDEIRACKDFVEVRTLLVIY